MVQKIKYQYRDTGTLQRQNQKVGRKRILTERQCNRISKLISENPSLTLEQLRANLKVDCCLTTIWHELKRQHKTFKKALSASEQHRTDVKAHRQRWKRMQRRLKINKLIFIDETGAKTNMTRRYGWGPSDQRVTEFVPHGHWETTTLIHAIDCNGSRASMITNGPTTIDVFELFVDWLLLPALRPG
jgi:transposase